MSLQEVAYAWRVDTRDLKRRFRVEKLPVFSESLTALWMNESDNRVKIELS